MNKKSIFYTFIVLMAVTLFSASCINDEMTKLDATMTTSQVQNITSSSATVTGFVVAEGVGVVERGVCYAATEGPTIDNNVVVYTGESKTATFKVDLAGLNFATKYYTRAYVKLKDGKVIYGEEFSFTTSPILATVTTSAFTATSSTTATGGGEVTADGGATVTASGVCYGLEHNPTITGASTKDGSGIGTFTSSLTNLTADTTYYVRAYATNSAGTVYGNEVAFTTPPPPPPLYPDNVYMIGQEFGSWNWSSDQVVEMTPINGNPGKFWAVRYFADPNNGFKWNTAKSWGGDFFSLGTDVGFTTHDGNAFVSTAGFYIVVVDYTVKTITIEPAQVYGMGDCFGGWNTGQYPFVAAGSVMKLTTSASGELRMYANSSAAGVGGDWWRMEFIILDGKIVYRGNGGDQTRVTVGAGKVVTLDFNNNTGTIQ